MATVVGINNFRQYDAGTGQVINDCGSRSPSEAVLST